MQYKDILVPLVRRVREMAMPGYGTIAVADQKSDNPIDVVTEIDRKVERYLIERLHFFYPHIPFVGEEFGGNRNVDQYWLSDPIDCTSNYMRGLPGCSSLLALIENGEPVVGVIYDFVHDDMYFAEAGCGAYLNDRQIHVSDRTSGAALISYESRGRKASDRKMINTLVRHFPNHRALSSGMELAHIAAGRIDGMATFDPFGEDLDFAAGVVLLREAGGIITNINGPSFDLADPNFIAGNRNMHAALSSLFRKYSCVT